VVKLSKRGGWAIDIKGVAPVRSVEDADRRAFVTNVEVGKVDEEGKRRKIRELVDAVRTDVTEVDPTLVVQTESIVETPYSSLSLHHVLSLLLPFSETEDIPSSFTMTGNVAHVNLRESHQQYKYLIGKAIIDKGSGVEIVVNKVGEITSQFRVFDMEIIGSTNPGDIGSEKALETEVKECGCRFRLDFRTVYWNSRLGYEHRRVCELIRFGVAGGANDKKEKEADVNVNVGNKNNEIVVADIMSGIGPFAIPLAKNYNVRVHANDLNPDSHKWLDVNVGLNKVKDRVTTYNLDGRAFVRKLEADGVRWGHGIMNLPDSAPEFLDVFRGMKFTGDLPIMHVHTFVKVDPLICGSSLAMKRNEDRFLEEIRRLGVEKVEHFLGCELENKSTKALSEGEGVQVHMVRDVAPLKPMLCVSFRLPRAVLALDRIEEWPKWGEDETVAKQDVDDVDGAEPHNSPPTKRMKKN